MEMCPIEPLIIGIETGEFPADAWFVVEVLGDGYVRVVEWGCFADVDVDWSPALEWAAGCSPDSCPPAPDGWRIQGLELVESLAVPSVRELAGR